MVSGCHLQTPTFPWLDFLPRSSLEADPELSFVPKEQTPSAEVNASVKVDMNVFARCNHYIHRRQSNELKLGAFHFYVALRPPSVVASIALFVFGIIFSASFPALATGLGTDAIHPSGLSLTLPLIRPFLTL